MYSVEGRGMVEGYISSEEVKIIAVRANCVRAKEGCAKDFIK